MTAVYENHGVHFLYPENWTLTEESQELPLEISVESPSGGFWALHIYHARDNTRSLVNDVVRVMRMEYDPVEADYVQEKLGPVMAEGYDMSFFYLDLLITCRARSFTSHEKTMVLITQAEDRDYQKLEPIFQAMTLSLLKDPATFVVDED